MLAGAEQARDGRKPDGNTRSAISHGHRLTARCQKRDHRQQGHDGQILKQQNRQDSLTFSGAEMSPRSSSICMTIVVEVITNPVPATKAGAKG